MYDIDRVVLLLTNYLKGNIDVSSDTELQSLLERYPGILELLDKIDNKDVLRNELEVYLSVDDEHVSEKDDPMLQSILSEIRLNKPQQRQVRFPFRRVAVAAAVLFAFFLALYMIPNRPQKDEITAMEIAASFIPGTNKALLTTSDGNAFELSSSQEKIIVGEDIIYGDGSTLLKTALQDQNVALTLETPRGGQYQVILSDGTKVWLNAASKLQYPKTFSGTARKVEVEGEAYFEVAKDTSKPFIVNTPQETVEVLGTHFNILAYPDEPTSYVSLLEGKVSVTVPNNTPKILREGQQSVVKGNTIKLKDINQEESIAWKNGEFMFNEETLGSAMRKLARWYDLEIEIDQTVQNISLWGSISRYENFGEVLQIIKLTDKNIHVVIEGRRVKLMK